jgi:glycosyltransferase involved in cell wall biosynthesis
MPVVSTMHNRLDLPDFVPIYRRFPRMPLVSVSDAQRAPLADMNWVGTVYHGLPSDLLRFSPRPQDYLAFIGRISPEKGIDRAIAVAEAVGIPLKIAAKVDNADRDYFETRIKPLIKPPLIEYIGEITEAEKSAFLGSALALIFAIDWPEPFGLAMIEALACGTPVIARPCGSVPEIIRHGVTGFLGTEVSELAEGVRNLGSLSRARCRQEFELRFTAPIMARKYEQIYYRLLEANAVAAKGRTLDIMNDNGLPAVDRNGGSRARVPLT